LRCTARIAQLPLLLRRRRRPQLRGGQGWPVPRQPRRNLRLRLVSDEGTAGAQLCGRGCGIVAHTLLPLQRLPSGVTSGTIRRPRSS
jgi:hypothetical protein